MSDVLREYREAKHELPDRILTWYLYGAGLENFGRDRKPVEVPMPSYGPGELLVRIDAVGICFSDIKVINQGNEHPRITGRDLENDPVTLGHEAAVTVVGVGNELRDRFHVGERFIVQADVFYRGKSLAFGYVLAGAQTQYQVIPGEMLDGDEGCYLLPIKEGTGYAEAALAEPWACVVASYRITRRTTVKPGGILWIIGTGDEDEYILELDESPSTVVATDVSKPMLDRLRGWADAGRFELVESPKFEGLPLEEFASKYEAFDDIIVLGADADIVERAASYLGKGGIMSITASSPLARAVKIDVGKVHYQNHAYLGTSSRDIRDAYAPVRLPSELKEGGTAWFIGAGGPMGQMHVQRAVEMKGGPSKVLATDIDTSRLKSVRDRFKPIAESRGVQLTIANPNEMTGEEYRRLLNEFTTGRGFDDIVVLAPVANLIEEATTYLADEGLMNIFAGVPIGTIAAIDLTGVYQKRIRFVGSSGSKISDLKDTLDAAESGQLSTNNSVAAIGGIEASWEGMLAAKEGRYPGKVVIYPQIRGLELTAVQDLEKKLPSVAEKLVYGIFWSREAEEELLRVMLRTS